MLSESLGSIPAGRPHETQAIHSDAVSDRVVLRLQSFSQLGSAAVDSSFKVARGVTAGIIETGLRFIAAKLDRFQTY